MKFWFAPILLICIVCFTIPSVWAQNSVSSEYGEITTDYEQYSINNSGKTLVKISGTGEMKDFRDNEKVFFTITLPDSSQQTMQIFSTKNGYFETFLSLDSTDPVGEWKIFVTFGTKVLGTIYFDVEKEPHTLFGDNSNNASDVPGTETSSLNRSNIISVETSSQNYTVGDTIEIFGYCVHNNLDRDLITLQIWSPKNNLILIDQFQPDDKTYSKLIKSGGQMWASSGEYTVNVQYRNQTVSTTFNFGMPTTGSSDDASFVSSSKANTVLKLNNLPSSFEIKGQGTATGTFSGRLLTEDRDPVANATIRFKLEGMSSQPDLLMIEQTDSSGKFIGSYSFLKLGTYTVQAVFDGNDHANPSKSTVKYFDVTKAVTPVSPPISSGNTNVAPKAQPASSAGFDPAITGIILVVLVSAIIGIIVVIAKKKKKQKVPQYVKVPPKAPQRAPPTSPNPPGNTESSTMFFYECPKCHGADVQNNPDGSVNCPDCGFRG